MAGIIARHIFNDKSWHRDDLRVAMMARAVEHRGPGETIRFKHELGEVAFCPETRTDVDLLGKFYKDDASSKYAALDGSIFNIDGIRQKYLGTGAGSGEQPHAPFTPARLLLESYEVGGTRVLQDLVGSVSGVIFDGQDLVGFKDPVGSKPLYFTRSGDDFLFASELKALAPLQTTVKPVNPGEIVFARGERARFHAYPQGSLVDESIQAPGAALIAKKLHALVEVATIENINLDARMGALLSGGVDSTIINAIAKDCVPDLKVYTGGVEGSTDVTYARKFAARHDLDHAVVPIELDDMLDVLPEVIHTLETFDAALIRSAVPMYLISREAAQDDIEILLTGEGGDELFGGYGYLKDLESPRSLQQEFLALLEVEHKTGLQRVDRIPYRFSIEARAPLFDRRLVEYSFKIPLEYKIRTVEGRKVDKWVLRKAFEVELTPEFAWRPKEKFSCGVGSQFILKEHLEAEISDQEFEAEAAIAADFSLRSKEELYYWRIFEDFFTPAPGTIPELGITSTYEV